MHAVRVVPSRTPLPKVDQLAYKLAEVAIDPVMPTGEVADMITNRIIDDAAVAIAAMARDPVRSARSQALCHPRPSTELGATLFGVPNDQQFSAEWAAWANSVAVRELDMHDTFLAADYAHPGDTIPPLVAVAQQCARSGAALLRAIATAYEVQIALTRAICLHAHKKDHTAHLAPAVAAGLGTLLGLDVDTIYQAIQQSVHVGFSTRQSRKGVISSWKAFAPAWAGKIAIEAVDRAMHGETSPSPIYEGEEGVIAYMLDGRASCYHVELPEPGEPRRGILESYTKEHSAEYQAQAFIDLAFRLRPRLPDLGAIERVIIRTSRHTHEVIGTGSGDPQKVDSTSSRETLDHSLMYVFAVALEDGVFHHEDSYRPERAVRRNTVELMRKIATIEDEAWTRAYHHPLPSQRAFGGHVQIIRRDGAPVEDEIRVADAHPAGRHPFGRRDYLQKFAQLTADWVSRAESDRFVALAEDLLRQPPERIRQLNVQVDLHPLPGGRRQRIGLF